MIICSRILTGRGRVRNRFFSRGGGGGNLICLEGVRARGRGAGGRGGAILLFITLLQGRRGGGNIIVWVRGGLTGRGEGEEDYHE